MSYTVDFFGAHLMGASVLPPVPVPATWRCCCCCGRCAATDLCDGTASDLARRAPAVFSTADFAPVAATLVLSSARPRCSAAFPAPNAHIVTPVFTCAKRQSVHLRLFILMTSLSRFPSVQGYRQYTAIAQPSTAKKLKGPYMHEWWMPTAFRFPLRSFPVFRYFSTLCFTHCLPYILFCPSPLNFHKKVCGRTESFLK